MRAQGAEAGAGPWFDPCQLDDIVQLTGIEPVMREATHLSRLV